jgi:hypothetical protein
MTWLLVLSECSDNHKATASNNLSRLCRNKTISTPNRQYAFTVKPSIWSENSIGSLDSLWPFRLLHRKSALKRQVKKFLNE